MSTIVDTKCVDIDGVTRARLEDSGDWHIGPLGRHGMTRTAVILPMGALADAASSPAKRQECLHQLSEKNGYHPTYMQMIRRYLDRLFGAFYGPPRDTIDSSSSLEEVSDQASLVRVWIEWLQSLPDAGEGEGMDAVMPMLWCRYYLLLATLVEFKHSIYLYADSEWYVDAEAYLKSWSDLEDAYRRALWTWSAMLMNLDNGPLFREKRDLLAQMLGTESASFSIVQIWDYLMMQLIYLKPGQLRSFFLTGQTGPAYLDFLARHWFLPRYDLDGATQLTRSLLLAQVPVQADEEGRVEKDKRSSSHGRLTGHMRSQAEQVGIAARRTRDFLALRGLHALAGFYSVRAGLPGSMVVVVALLLVLATWTGSPSSCRFPAIGPLDSVSLDAFLLASSRTVLLGAAGALLLLLIVVVAASLRLAETGRMAFYPFSLRLAAGTLVGLIALSGLSDQFATYAFRAFGGAGTTGHFSPAATLVLLGSALFGSWFYMYLVALGRLGAHGPACRRALALFVYGWAQATVFAAAASWLAASRLISLGAGSEPCRGVEALTGVLYFDFIIVAGVLGLAVGVFTQILWEDRSVSDPL